MAHKGVNVEPIKVMIRERYSIYPRITEGPLVEAQAFGALSSPLSSVSDACCQPRLQHCACNPPSVTWPSLGTGLSPLTSDVTMPGASTSVINCTSVNYGGPYDPLRVPTVTTLLSCWLASSMYCSCPSFPSPFHALAAIVNDLPKSALGLAALF
jgi:hypothetical protein